MIHLIIQYSRDFLCTYCIYVDMIAYTVPIVRASQLMISYRVDKYIVLFIENPHSHLYNRLIKISEKIIIN